MMARNEAPPSPPVSVTASALADASGGVLFCAATRAEVETLCRPADGVIPADGVLRLSGDVVAHAAVTGVGIPATLLALPSLLARLRPRGVVVTGIAGAYPGAGFGIGDLILGTSETFADLGMELPDEEGFRPVWTFPFAKTWPAAFALHAPPALRAMPGLRPGIGATVNTCTGTDATGALRRRLFGADFETMEGAAAAAACHAAGIPVCGIRAVSNMAARRDIGPEGIAHALESLRVFWGHQRDRVCTILAEAS